MAERRLTVFGSVMVQLMLRRGLMGWNDLIRAMENSYQCTAPGISGWVYGRHSVNYKFVQAFSETLDLVDEERTVLAVAFAYGQGRYVDEDLEDPMLERALRGTGWSVPELPADL